MMPHASLTDPDKGMKITICELCFAEQEEIAKEKACGEALTWNDISYMKYTWMVVMEILRLIPPAFGGFRQVLKDIEFDGYLIPKGWQESN